MPFKSEEDMKQAISEIEHEVGRDNWGVGACYRAARPSMGPRTKASSKENETLEYNLFVRDDEPTETVVLPPGVWKHDSTRRCALGILCDAGDSIGTADAAMRVAKRFGLTENEAFSIMPVNDRHGAAAVVRYLRWLGVKD